MVLVEALEAMVLVVILEMDLVEALEAEEELEEELANQRIPV